MLMCEQMHITEPTSTQSRVVEVSSWNNYVDEVRLAKSVFRKSIAGNLEGETMPKSVTIESFKNSERNLFCSFRRYDGVLMWKVAYLLDSGAS